MSVRAQANFTKVGDTYSSTTVGEAIGYTAADVAGDSIPLSGSYVLVSLKTAGTGSTVTLDSVGLSSHGQDTNVTCVLAATDEKEFLIDLTAGGDRWKQVSGNVGYLNLTYTSVTTLSIRAKQIA
jgi:hypothetical protein